YGPMLWLDPGETAVHEHSLRVMLDVVRRYDVDGVHLDDYFYPYREKDEAKKPVDFPDDPSWRKYQKSGGRLTRDDWRRDNVNRFVQRFHAVVKAEKPWVKVGISPFGIWKPGVPPGIRGMDATQEIYADALKWFHAGWLDYLSPQLYWSIDAPEQSFPVLLKWWAGQNAAARHLWPGISAANIGPGRNAEEIIRQLKLIRAQPGAGGSLQWSIKALHQNRDGLADKLVRQINLTPALIPASPWLDKAVPERPLVAFGQDAARTVSVFQWGAPGGGMPGWWLVQMRFNGVWRTELLPGGQLNRSIRAEAGALPELIAVSGVSRYGQMGQAFVAQRTGRAD
ncbi:MAG: family 10 glycosylhydrolase, partial [Limisphaerales bacterium]